ncbi:MAG: hypothetical protein NTV62_04380, partial [Candidatus Gribaldobacteria bacterium]|nr:hypothetical protein [Candidatus Gribaldobacteria bacterium]
MILSYRKKLFGIFLIVFSVFLLGATETLAFSYCYKPNPVSCSQPCGVQSFSLVCPDNSPPAFSHIENFTVDFGSSCEGCGVADLSQSGSHCCSTDPSKCLFVCNARSNNNRIYFGSWPPMCTDTWIWEYEQCQPTGGYCYRGLVYTSAPNDCFGNPPPSGCVSNCACTTDTCLGSTCSNGCGGTCNGTKNCGGCVPNCPSDNTYCSGKEPNNGCGSKCPAGTKPTFCPLPSTYCNGSEPDNGCGAKCQQG